MPIAAAQRTAAIKGIRVFKGKRTTQFTLAASVPPHNTPHEALYKLSG
ncbi:MAG: hypothetical protein PVSMB1_08270 [Gemmatimonadaceae bacterium]|jgi:hypothetical protein